MLETHFRNLKKKLHHKERLLEVIEMIERCQSTHATYGSFLFKSLIVRRSSSCTVFSLVKYVTGRCVLYCACIFFSFFNANFMAHVFVLHAFAFYLTIVKHFIYTCTNLCGMPRRLVACMYVRFCIYA